MHFGRQFEHEMHSSEICAKTAEQQPEWSSRFCLQATQTTSQRQPSTSSPISYLVMKHGCMVMTLRLSSSHRSGSRQFHHSRKKCIKFAVMASPCWLFFSTFKALSTRNSYSLVKSSMASFTVRFWSGWGRAFSTNVQTGGKKQLVSPPWQLAHSHITRCLTIPDFQKHYSDFPPPPLRLFPIPQHEITAERASFWYDWGEPRRIAGHYQHTHIWELPGMHEIMANMLGSLHTCPRELLQRRRWKLGVTARNFFLQSNSPNFWVAPHVLSMSPGTSNLKK